MSTKYLRISCALALALCAARTPGLWAQEAAGGSASSAPRSRVDAILPVENPNVVFVEGEDAVSTNFSSQPTLNYSTSGKRTLQLSTATDLQAEAGYYADYVFYVPASGEYELWYGGTPAGPLDELYPSFFSPFRYRLDGGEPVAVYREDIVVNQNYAPSFYWNRVHSLTLKEGVHRLRYEVREKRRYDNRYYFYLDCFFLVQADGGDRVLGQPLPELFPRDLASTAIDHPFRSVDDYLIIVNQTTDRAQKTGRQIELATIYSMIGDYVNALRYLSRAAVLAPDSAEILLLQAKNQIWKGDIGDGLTTYRRLLEIDPDQVALWVEAGKVAAWTGRYDDSVAFLRGGLDRFPGNVDLMVNLGLTYLWASRVTEADRMFRGSLQAAGDDLDKLKYLAGVYRINGYPEQAIPIYRAAIAKVPASLGSYLLLESTYRALGKTADAEVVTRQIQEVFVPSPELDRYLGVYRIKQGLIDATIQEYQEALAVAPDNLELRQLLAQTFYWNGRQREAIEEYLHILMNHTYRQVRALEKDSVELLRVLDTSYLLARFGAVAPEMSRVARADLDVRSKEYARAAADLAKGEESVRKAAESPEGASAELQADLARRQDALDEQARLSAAALQSASGVIARIEAAVALYADLKADVQKLSVAEAEVQRLFKDEIKVSRWIWNRQETVAEASAQAAQGLAIAQYVVARIAAVERRFPVASAAYDKLGDAEMAYTFGRGQAALWEGKLDAGAYVTLIQGLADGTVSYAAGLAEAARELGLAGEAEQAGLVGSLGDPGEEVSASVARLDGLLKQVEAMRRDLPAVQRVAHRLLSDGLARAFYRLEEGTAKLRNELGDFYLKIEDRAGAIRQYRYVLAVDPSNIDAIFRLGTTSSLAGDWSGALAYYERVYRADPYYENVINIYNRIAEEHADTAHATATYAADTSRVSWTGGGGYTVPLSSAVGIRASYDVGSFRSVEQLVNPAYSGLVAVTHHLAYATQTVGISVPVRLYRAGLGISPRAGVAGVLESQYFTGDPGAGSALYPTADLFDPADGAFDPFAFFGSHGVYPFAGLDLDLDRAGAVRVQASVRYGTYAQTLAKPKVPRQAFEASLGVSPVLTFLGVPVLRDVYLRSYGEIAVLPASSGAAANTVGLVAQDVVVPFRSSSRLSPTLALDGSLYYADSTATEPVYEYYSPHRALTVKGGLSGSLTFPLQSSGTLSFSARVAGGYVRSFDMFLSRIRESALLEGSSNLSLTRRGLTVGLRTVLSATLDATTGALGYWSLSTGIDLSARSPRLLMPR